MGLPQTIKRLAEYGGVQGVRVTRNAAALGAIAAAGYTLFNITNGRVYVTSIYGIVVVQLAAVATTVGLRVRPAAGGGLAVPQNLDSLALNVNAEPVGTIWSLPDLVTNPMLAALAEVGVANSSNFNKGFVAPAGEIEYVVGGADNTTGTVRWVLFYVEIDPGAKVYAA